MIPSSDIRRMLAADQGFAGALATELASCYRAVVRELKNQKLRSAVDRLANHLLRLDRDQGGNGVIALPYDKRTLASLLGMTPENLSRSFAALKSYGVEVNGSSIRLGLRQDLERLAKPSRLIDEIID